MDIDLPWATNIGMEVKTPHQKGIEMLMDQAKNKTGNLMIASMLFKDQKNQAVASSTTCVCRAAVRFGCGARITLTSSLPAHS